MYKGCFMKSYIFRKYAVSRPYFPFKSPTQHKVGPTEKYIFGWPNANFQVKSRLIISSL